MVILLTSRLNDLGCLKLAFWNWDLVNLLSLVLYRLICVELKLLIVVTYIAKSPNLLSYEV